MLSVDNISVNIKNKTIIKNVSVEAEKGDLIAIVGPNGAGKSTLLKSICGDFGKKKIQWKERQLHAIKTEKLAKERAVLNQKTNLTFDFTADEVVMMGRYPHFKNKPLLEDFEVVERMMEVTQTLSFKNRSYQTLSGGEQQRIQCARLFSQLTDLDYPDSAKLYLLDEPLNNLDIQHQHLLMDQLAKIAKQGHVVMIVMHDLNLAAEFADKVLLMENGGVKAFGKAEKVLTADHISEAYQIPAKVYSHPFKDCPMIYFGNQNTIKDSNYSPKMMMA